MNGKERTVNAMERKEAPVSELRRKMGVERNNEKVSQVKGLETKKIAS